MFCGSGGGGNRPNTEASCESLSEQTTLNSVDEEVLAGVRVGQVLDVVALSSTGPLAAEDHRGAFVGSITSASLGRILECIDEGHRFVAEVKSISGGQVIVLVRHR
jgi:hypothetical protein